ncbi:rho GTPase-activating protein 11A-like [Rhinatrema bivittatum]|uniref:rho GTPase-activating protein 11A-like n=1 Tax=Rhinatrema bivittatum TaxID=194408 RepID=UPI00112CB366|nr:rho GTPase-activating protein 11A-like [Rhinatrema bivittatum]
MKLSEERQTMHAIVQHLKTAGIKIRRWKANSSEQQERPLSTSSGLFGVPLHVLPLSQKEGPIPQFLVDVCHFLNPHLHTEGLFRKSGSMTRIKALKARLETGEKCLDSALPCDVAALLKQFFRDLPHPLIPVELQEPLYRIQELVPESERGSVTALVTCLLPRVSACTLRYLCTFLQRIATRCDENKMDSGNLALVLAPNLFPSSELSERLTVGTERQLQLQVAVLETLITNALEIGHVPHFIAEKVSSMQELETACRHPVPQGSGEQAASDENCRRRRRRSMGEIVNGALSKLKTGHVPSGASQKEQTPAAETDSNPIHRTSFKTKRKASEDSCEGSELKKRKATLDFIPGQLLADDDALRLPDGSLADTALVGRSNESPKDVLSPNCFWSSAALDVPGASRSPASIKRQRSKRLEGKRVQRVPSGCCSPSAMDRTDKVRKSLRLFQRTRTEKEESGEPSTLETSGWTLMKRMVADALEGPLFPGKDFRITQSSVKASEQGHGTPGEATAEEVPPETSPGCDEALSSSSPGSRSQSALAPDTETKSRMSLAFCRAGGTGRQTLDSSAGRDPDPQAVGNSSTGPEKEEGGFSAPGAEDPSEGSTVPHPDSVLVRAPESPEKHRRVLRRSLSLPENLLESMEGTPLETRQEVDPPVPAGSPSTETMPGVDGCLKGQQLQTNAGTVSRVNSALQLGLPLVLVTLADEHSMESLVTKCLGSGEAAAPDLSEEGDRARNHPHHKLQETLGICVSVADCIRKLKISSKSAVPKRSMHKLTMNFQRAAPEGPSERNCSPLKRRGARKFGRSLSHESGLAMGAGVDATKFSAGGGPAATPPPSLAEQGGGHLSTRGARSPQPCKSPLKSLKTYSRQIFISRKHITLSFAGLRGKKELGAETATSAVPAPRSAGFFPEALGEGSDVQEAAKTDSQGPLPQECLLQPTEESASVSQASPQEVRGYEEIECC